MQQGAKNNPKDRGAPGRKRSLNGLLTRDNLIRVKHKKFRTFHPREHLNVFNGEEPSVSYLQLPVKRKKKIVSVPDVVKRDMGDIFAKRQHGANFAPQIHMLHKPARGMKSS